jgi:hypothetical protein
VYDILGAIKVVVDHRQRTWGSIIRRSPGTPKRTLAVKQEDYLRWSAASKANKPAMMVVGDFHLTNVHTGTTSVQKTFLVVRRRRHLWLRRLRFEGNLGVQGHNIRSGRTTTGRAIWYI